MILTGKRRQRLGDLAARTAVTRASAPAPRPERRGRERFALWAYPCVWLAPAILLFALVPDTRLLSCKDAGISAETGQEGSCLMTDGHGGEGVLQAVNIGHTLRLPRYSVRVLGTGAQQAPTRLLGARYYRNGSTVVVGFKLAVENTGNAPLRFATYSHQVLGVPRPDGLGMAAVRELPRAAHSGFHSFAEGGPIAPGRTKVAWVSFGVPPDAVPMLRQPIAGLALIPKADSGGLAHVGEIRLYRAATPAGAQALAGLRY
jgi:hypothetical protein